nr:hypothetical protein [Tanacetum cinerariifolium]
MAAVEVPQTLEYRDGQLNAAPVLEVKIFTNWKKRFMCHILGIEPQFKNIIKNCPFIPMTASQKKQEGQQTGDERKATNLDQRLKSLIMSVLLDDQMNSVINCLTAKSTWDDLQLYHEGPSDVKESRVMDLKLCYNTFKFKEGETLKQTFTGYKALMNKLEFQDSPDNEEDTRSSHEYLNDLEEEYQARALLAKSKRFFKKGTQRFNSAKATDQTECHKYGKKGHFVRDCWSKALVPSYQSPFQPKPLSPSQHKPELRPTKDFEAKYNKVNAKLALLSSSALASKAVTIKNKGHIVEAYEWDEEEVSTYENKMVKVKVLMALVEENDAISKEGTKNEVDQLNEDPSSSGQKDLVFVKSLADDTKVSILCIERPWLSEAEGLILPNHDTGRILPTESQRNTTDPLVDANDSSATECDSTNESSVYSIPLPPLKKLDGAKPISGPKTIKSILRLKSTFKAETLKGVAINKPSSAPAKGNKNSSASKVNSAPAGKLKSVKIKDDPPLAIHLKILGRSSRPKNPRPSKHFFPTCIHCGFNDHLSDDCVNYPIYDIFGSYDHDTHGHNRIISLRRGIKPENPQRVMKSCETCGSTFHITTDHNDMEWFKRGEELQEKRKPIWYLDSGCSRHITGVKSYLHKYVEQPRPK